MCNHKQLPNTTQQHSPLELELSFVLALLEAQGLEQQQGAHQGGQFRLERVALRADRLVPETNSEWEENE